jgi:hypothetical protein
MESFMASTHQGPFWNQDAIVASGLAFAAMASLQSKLFPAIARLNHPLLTQIFDSKVFAWWPVLLIVSGVALWIKKSVDKRSQKNPRSAAQVGGGK